VASQTIGQVPSTRGLAQGRQDLEQDVNIPREDYLSTLPPRAQGLLRAARRLLIEKGYDALRWERIAAEAGEQKSLIRYYFKDKAGLISALLRVLAYDATVWMVERSDELPAGPERISTHVAAAQELTRHPEFISFFDVLPHALRDQELRPQIAELYAWYREMNLRGFGVAPSPENRADLEATASLFLAAADGIAIQAALDPGRYDPRPAFAKLERALRLLLLEAGGPPLAREVEEMGQTNGG
jgi:AcrR family transcriptional regulator